MDRLIKVLGNLLKRIFERKEKRYFVPQQIDISYEDILKLSQTNLERNTNLTFSRQESLDLLGQMKQFELGRSLLMNRGLNGYWTSYIVLYSGTEDIQNPLEYWLLNKAPFVRATRERFWIFQQEIQKRVHSNMILAAIPCGLMDNFLSLNYSGIKNIKLVGIDYNEQSIKLAQKNAKKYRMENKVQLIHADAWNFDVVEHYDLITSNGLNIYESDDKRQSSLYRNFYKALRPKGFLITSFLTPPPSSNVASPWRNFNPADVKKQKAIFTDIIKPKWENFRTEEMMRECLEHIGFNIIDVIDDSQRMFPTIIAQK